MRKIDGLTSIRAFAALWVVLQHYRYGDRALEMPFSFLFRTGTLGVPVFFILSGFILGYSYQSTFVASFSGGFRAEFWRYAVARFARIYPVHIVVLLLFPLLLVPLGIWPDLPNNTLTSFACSAFLLHGWGFLKTVVWNQASWSVSTEFFCYLVFPALVFGLHRLPRWASGAMLALCLFWLHTGLWEELAYRLDPQLVVGRPFILMLCRYSLLFVTGYFLFNVYDGIRARIPSLLTSCALVGSLAGIVWAASLPERYHSLTYLFTCTLIFSLAAGTGFVRSAFGCRPLVYAGEISYSLYLTHEASRETLHTLLRLFAPEVTLQQIPLALELAFALAIAAVFFELLEKPARQWIRSLSRPRPAIRTGASVGTVRPAAFARRLPEEIWATFEPILPPVVRDQGGRLLASNHACLHGLLYVLVTGIGWEYVPPCFPPGPILRQRLRAWRGRSEFQAAWQRLAERYEPLRGIDWDQLLRAGPAEQRQPSAA